MRPASTFPISRRWPPPPFRTFPRARPGWSTSAGSALAGAPISWPAPPGPLWDQGLDFQLDLVGYSAKGREEAMIRDLLGPELASGRALLRRLGFDQVHEAYERAHLAVVPTRQGEGTSLACLEAFAFGLPGGGHLGRRAARPGPGRPQRPAGGADPGRRHPRPGRPGPGPGAARPAAGGCPGQRGAVLPGPLGGPGPRRPARPRLGALTWRPCRW